MNQAMSTDTVADLMALADEYVYAKISRAELEQAIRRAVDSSLEAAKQEPLTDEQINELICAQSFWKTLANETGWSLTAELHDFARAVLAAAPSPGSGT